VQSKPKIADTTKSTTSQINVVSTKIDEAYYFDEYSVHGVKGKKGPVFQPVSSKFTKRKNLQKLQEEEKISADSIQRKPTSQLREYKSGIASTADEKSFKKKVRNDDVTRIREQSENESKEVNMLSTNADSSMNIKHTVGRRKHRAAAVRAEYRAASKETKRQMKLET